MKARIRQLFSFLKEANQLRFRPVRSLEDHLKALHLEERPKHPSIQLYRPVSSLDTEQIPEVLLRITRPTTTHCPPPPEAVAPWLITGWDDPDLPATYVESRNEQTEDGQVITVKFDYDERRTSEFAAWVDQRHDWAIPERMARQALRFFETFYDLYSTIEKDREQLELILGDGHLLWRTDSAIDGQVDISHPVLLKRVELRFDANTPEFTVHDTDRETELYSSLFLDLKEVAPAAISTRKSELDAAGYHPLGWEETEAFLKALVQSISPINGEFLSSPTNNISNQPRMWRDPVLFLRERGARIANAIDAIVEDIERREVFPAALTQITGALEDWSGSGIGGDENVALVAQRSLAPIADEDILLAKEANAEQIQIIRRLHHAGSVIVQGPPGTGKTHTIGNIIGHLLSQGKSILVTAQTAKALRVLRDKVPKTLQPLCVSVLGSDQDARDLLDSSIGHISERLTRDSSVTLLRQASELELNRKRLLERIGKLKHKLREALENEYRTISVGQLEFSPSNAGRFVANNHANCGWIPGPVRLGVALNLSDERLARLYQLGTEFSQEEETDARLPVPDLNKLPSEREFRLMVSDYEHIRDCDLSFGMDKWRPGRRESAQMDLLAETLRKEFSDDLRRQAWRPYAIVAGIHGGTEKEVWEKLISAIEQAAEANARNALMLHHRPQYSPKISLERQIELTGIIGEHLSSGGRLGFFQLATRAEWRQFIKTASVANGRPRHSDHFEAINCRAVLVTRRIKLKPLWDSLIGERNNSLFDSLGSQPEMSCVPLVREIRRCLEWSSSVWKPITEALTFEGLDLEAVTSSIPHSASQISEYSIIERIAIEVLPPLLLAERNRRRLRECEALFDSIEVAAEQLHPNSTDQGCLGGIVAAIRARHVDGYGAALTYTRRIAAVVSLVAERDSLSNELKAVAPKWSEQIFFRMAPHNEGKPLGNVREAWIWRQLHDELVERDALDPHTIQNEIEDVGSLLRETTQSLIDSKTWGQQIERLQGRQSVRQALIGWLDTEKRLKSTRQLSRRQTLLSESRKLMKKCTSAVPVWIMPISIVAENFDTAMTRFDVVIIDEASQADLNALIPLYMGDQVIVVGDHEQVTPLGVGKDTTLLNNLRRAMLEDIPNSHLFDNQSSIYDIGRQSFGDTVRLAEHFRCVPEIIAFSNQLSYAGAIRPLRESNSTHLKPACVPYKVEGVRNGDINSLEAKTIVALVKAMTKHHAYAGKTIGIISMLKESQAALIQSMLHKEVDSVDLVERRIVAGLSAEFQGDERDVIILSMVDSQSAEGTLRATGEGAFELTKKRYNVAASRARDQLWVVHSFDPELHLKSHDLRSKLLRHVKDPMATIRAFELEAPRTESPFEREVLKYLTGAGFRVRTQWKVGYYRIDMVVEGGGRRLAVECDGDRYHPIERLSEDMERQSVLERLGWKFERIRGSAFYRNPELAMRPVFEKLRELEITPDGEVAEDAKSDMTLVYELEGLMMLRPDPEQLTMDYVNLESERGQEAQNQTSSASAT